MPFDAGAIGIIYKIFFVLLASVELIGYHFRYFFFAQTFPTLTIRM